MTPRPTAEGLVVLALVGGLSLLAAALGSNALLLLVAPGLGLLVVEAVLGSSNLAGLQVARRLPADLVAGRPARGALVLRAAGRRLPAVAVEVLDGSARAVFERLDPGEEREAACAWRFARRGVAQLEEVRLRSRFPFGLMVRERCLPLPAEVVVVPQAALAGLAPPSGGAGLREEGPAAGGGGELLDLRPYQPGDPPRSLHWRTSARAGQPMVVRRAELGGERLVVRLQPASGRAWERAIERACGEVVRACERGWEVGLELPDQRLPPRRGTGWRRALLEALARLPARPEEGS